MDKSQVEPKTKKILHVRLAGEHATIDVFTDGSYALLKGDEASVKRLLAANADAMPKPSGAR